MANLLANISFIALSITFVLCTAIVASAGEAHAASPNVRPGVIEPLNNPSTPAKVLLGKRLFSENALSINNSYSCAACHIPEKHFTDGRKVAIGVTGQQHSRNTPTLYNVAYNSSFGWDDQGLTTLEAQHRVPLLNTDPLEMGYSIETANKRLNALGYETDFKAAFSEAENQLPRTTLITRALATYVRTLTHPSSRFDDYLFGGDSEAISDDAKAGLALFTQSRIGCATCHAGFAFSGPTRDLNDEAPATFHLTAVDGATTKFRAPTLRAIRYTAPYMHAGNLDTLAEVIAHYESTTAPEIPDFSLTDLERQQLIAFLETL